MELLRTLNTRGRPLLVYIDAEFQTYRVPSENDQLAALGYKNTPYHHGMNAGNFGNNKYFFLLSLGFIIINEEGNHNHFAIFRSNFAPADAGFGNPQLLEPGYTTCKPYTDYQITEKRALIGEKGTFPYYADFHGDTKKQNAFKDINRIYNSSIADADIMESYATLSYFINYVAPHAMIVHKGRNDLYALCNTAHLFGMTMPPILTRDLDRVALKLPDLIKTKLDIVQTYFTSPPPLPKNITGADPVHVRLHVVKPALIKLRAILLKKIRKFFIYKWGAGAGTVAAHNPLVDCVYTAIMDLGLGSSADGAISWCYIDVDGVLQFSA
jgi:hypothetical protein